MYILAAKLFISTITTGIFAFILYSFDHIEAACVALVITYAMVIATLTTLYIA